MENLIRIDNTQQEMMFFIKEFKRGNTQEIQDRLAQKKNDIKELQRKLEEELEEVEEELEDIHWL